MPHLTVTSFPSTSSALRPQATEPLPALGDNDDDLPSFFEEKLTSSSAGFVNVRSRRDGEARFYANAAFEASFAAVREMDATWQSGSMEINSLFVHQEDCHLVRRLFGELYRACAPDEVLETRTLPRHFLDTS